MASRKHKTLTLEDKIEIIKLINSDAIFKTFGIGKSTAGDIKKNKDSIMKFVSTTESGSKVRKTMKTADNVALENAVYLWFIQQRRLHVPLSGEMICEEALLFHRQMTEGDEGFVVSKGWLDRFKHHHGIRRLKIIGEKVSNLQWRRIRALFWRMLPDKTLADLNEKVAPGRKVIKARITFMPCANVTNIRFLCLLSEQPKNPEPSSQSRSLYVNVGKKKTLGAHESCSWSEFVPAVRQHMKSVNLPQQPLLLLDNCPGHPSAEELCTDDAEISQVLLTSILKDPVHNQNLENALKKLNLKDVVFSLANCWAYVSTLLTDKSWKNLLSNFIDSEAEENVQTEEIQLAPLINQLQNSNPISAEADDSLARVEILEDDEIIRTVTAEVDDDDDDDTPVNSVKFLILRLWRHSILHYSGLKSKILKHTKLCSSDV
ncbi:hypothetical protein J437_LFUL014864 [Ladona fulva]|uniref:HTH CENPB-type domain-containing protein n=1 Tax=Ladona fulva TaxID=123851 RepID=A0A8K0KFR4_LADFU|nr:hypothetical protein J437_LFUL014864 [Ladona fulva]